MISVNHPCFLVLSPVGQFLMLAHVLVLMNMSVVLDLTNVCQVKLFDKISVEGFN